MSMENDSGPTFRGSRRPDRPGEPEELRISEADRLPPWLEAADEEPPQGKRSPILTAAIVGGAVAALGIAYLVYQSQTAERGGPPPTVKADQGPFKVRPDEPGGLEVPNQDNTVYDRMGAAQPSEPEQLLPPPERPKDAPPVSADAASTATGAQTAPSPAPRTAPATGGASGGAMGQAEKPAALAPPPSPAAGSFLIQLGAFNSGERAEAGWRTVRDKHSSLLGGLASDIQLADLGAKGIFHRLRAGPFSSRAAADAVCAELKAKKQDCMVVPR